MFRLVRAFLIFLGIALTVLLAWAITGSWKNERYLTDTYLLSLDLTNLNLQKIFDQVVDKRDLEAVYAPKLLPLYHTPDLAGLVPSTTHRHDAATITASPALNKRIDLAGILSTATLALGQLLDISIPSDLPSTVPTAVPLGVTIPTAIPSEYASYIPSGIPTDLVPLLLADALSILANPSASIDTILSNIVSSIVSKLSPQQLGLAQIYTISFWGYCRGSRTNGTTYDANSDFANTFRLFEGRKLNMTWCSPPKAAYALDPAALIKNEIGNLLNGYQPDGRLPAQVNDIIKAQLQIVQNSINNTDIHLPQDLQNYIGLLNRVTKAAFALMLAGCCLSTIAVILQLLGFCINPRGGCCLSFFHFLYQLLMVVTTVVGCGLATGVYIFVRSVLNKEVDSYGIKTSLLINFYAFAWLGAVAAIIFFLVEIIGLICMCCTRNKPNRNSKNTYYPYLLAPNARYYHGK